MTKIVVTLGRVKEAKDRVDESRFFRYKVNMNDPEFLEEEFSLPSRCEMIYYFSLCNWFT